MEVKLKVLCGPAKQPEFPFDEPGGFTFGRGDDCTCVMPADDMTFSRHHFMLEINPPGVTLKDLGSLNGTFVNGVKHGGREKDTVPEDAGASAPVSLRDGDKIRAGACELELAITAPAICVDCGKEVPREKREAAEFVGGTYLCEACRDKEKQKKLAPKAPAAARRAGPPKFELSIEQRKRAEEAPGAVIQDLLRGFLAANVKNRPPAIQGYGEIKYLTEGGFGMVWLATRLSDGKQVILKTMLQTRKPPKRQMLMFEREKEIALQLKHPNIVECSRADQWQDIHFMELEYMDAGSVWDILKVKRKLPLATAAPIMIQALEGLAFAHRAKLAVTLATGTRTITGVVHRDLKPPNILLSGTSGKVTAKVSDFGLAKAFSEAGMTKGSISVEPGTCCGSPPYVAPEHIVNYRHVKPPTDVFEMAATFYHMLAGVPVWIPKPGVEPFKVALESTVKPIEKLVPDLHKSVAEVFQCALSREPDDRYKDGGEMLKAMKNAFQKAGIGFLGKGNQ